MNVCPLSTLLTDSTYLCLPVLVGKDGRTGYRMERGDSSMREVIKLQGPVREKKNKIQTRRCCFDLTDKDNYLQLFFRICFYECKSVSGLDFAVGFIQFK